jgi:pyruvate/2-oxoglutarate dehydrogenase complex dihydrolipoamide acyltransferase (E2) component
MVNNKNNINKLAMPSAAKIIKERNLNIDHISGTGIDGRVTKGDVLQYLMEVNTSKKSKTQNSNNKTTKNNRKGNGMDILVPVLGESVVEATVSKWIKKEGDFVEVDEPIVELETDKVTLEVPASVAGTIDSIVVSEGDTVEVGALLGVIVEGERKTQSPKAKTIINNDKVDEVIKTNKVSVLPNNFNSDVNMKSNNQDLEERVPMSRLRLAILQQC